jgi:hypothetical protein
LESPDSCLRNPGCRRDLLLPKFISGEVDVSDFYITIPEDIW